MGDSDIGLADALDLVRTQLAEARRRAAVDNQDVVFGVGDVTVELGVELVRNAGGRLGLTVGVVTASGGAGVSRQTSHKITVSLSPRDASDREIEVADTG